MLSKQTISSKIAIIGLFLLLAFLADLKFRQWQNQNAINQQKQSLQDQADGLQKKNDELNQSLGYLNSESFKERVARQQLGLKKEGESVYSFGDAPATSGESAGTAAGISNAQKWWNYFFSL